MPIFDSEPTQSSLPRVEITARVSPVDVRVKEEEKASSTELSTLSSTCLPERGIVEKLSCEKGEALRTLLEATREFQVLEDATLSKHGLRGLESSTSLREKLLPTLAFGGGIAIGFYTGQAWFASLSAVFLSAMWTSETFNLFEVRKAKRIRTAHPKEFDELAKAKQKLTEACHEFQKLFPDSDPRSMPSVFHFALEEIKNDVWQVRNRSQERLLKIYEYSALFEERASSQSEITRFRGGSDLHRFLVQRKNAPIEFLRSRDKVLSMIAEFLREPGDALSLKIAHGVNSLEAAIDRYVELPY